MTDMATSTVSQMARPRPTRGRGSRRHRLSVIASSVADVVGSAAGLLFDRGMAGWQVNVLLAGQHDERPLQILGAGRLDLGDEIESVAGIPRAPAALAVAADVFAADERVRRGVPTALHAGNTQVTLWGPPCPTQLAENLGGTVAPVQYRLSAAALVFKAHALEAAAIRADSVRPTEEFFSAANVYPLMECDLLPVG